MLHEIFTTLAYFWSDWVIPWGGIAAVLAGTGSFLTGFAALKAAQKQGASDKNEAEETNTPNSSNS